MRWRGWFEGGTERTGSRLLALVPVSVALLVGAVSLPRAVPPENVPLPVVDGHALAAVRLRDHALAENARRTPLPGEVRALGSAIRTFNSLQANDAAETQLAEARRAVDEAIPPAFDADKTSALAALRAVQLDSFLTEARAFEATGKETEELNAVAGPFVRKMREAGWMHGNTILMDEDARRAAFKITWNGIARVRDEERPELAPSIDEARALYMFYLRRPHASESARGRYDEARKTAPTREACDAIDGRERVAIEAWRIDKIKKLGTFDPTYPTDFALGVANFRMGKYAASVESFRDWIRVHPDGPYALRARNHLHAAMIEAGRD